MAKQILAGSIRHRNSILRIISTNGLYLCNNSSFPKNSPPYSFRELDILVGLAFAAILSEGSGIDACRPQLDIFLDQHLCREDPSDAMVAAVAHIFRKGFSAFKFLGYPYFFDDFINPYLQVLKTDNLIFPAIKHDMQHILNEVF
jgi:hypothetical protein